MEVWGGIECTINRVDDNFFDQLMYAGHYERQEDLKLICDLGISKIRYPILWEKHQPDPKQQPIWTMEDNLNYLKSRNVEVIAGLVHHGSGPKYAPILSEKFVSGLADYAQKVAEKFPWINEYTPINEPLTTARFCGLYGFWHPHHKNDNSFLQILINQCKGTILAMQAIKKINPNAKLIQTEDLAKTHSTSKLKTQANFENQRRWLSIDLLCGKVNPQHPLWKRFKRAGIESQLKFFIENPLPPDVLGFNYYITSERFIDENLSIYPPQTHGGNSKIKYADIEVVRTKKAKLAGPKNLLEEAWNRYKLPIAITEAHLHCGREEQLRWLNYIWKSAKKLEAEGVKILSVTIWSMLGAYGWDKLLTKNKGKYESGAFDLSMGTPRPTALTQQIAHFVKDTPYTHPILQSDGWWEKPTRLIYGHQIYSNPKTKLNTNVTPVLIIGANGTLGSAFTKLCTSRGITYQALTRNEVDFTDPQQIEAIINKYKPWAIINTAGFVKVDVAEQETKNCFLSNTIGPVNLAINCEKFGIKLLTFSSDLVFDGLKKSSYVESDIVNPLNIYGLSKAKADEQVMHYNPTALIVRTSAFFGPWDKYNFIYQVLDSLKNGKNYCVANDVYISPTYVPDLVSASLNILIDNEIGIWHLANKGELTWYELALEVTQRANLSPQLLKPLSVEELGFKAKRPFFSALSSTKGEPLPPLEQALDHFFESYKFN